MNNNAGSENIYELHYAIPLTPWLVLTPDIQYIDNPGADGTQSHTIVGGVKLRVTF